MAGHYSDSNHFVYELLQNEDVRASKKVVIEYYCDKLIFYHNGKPFDEDDVRGVSSMLMGTKSRDDASTIGKFGMGFKLYLSIHINRRFVLMKKDLLFRIIFWPKGSK